MNPNFDFQQKKTKYFEQKEKVHTKMNTEATAYTYPTQEFNFIVNSNVEILSLLFFGGCVWVCVRTPYHTQNKKLK